MKLLFIQVILWLSYYYWYKIIMQSSYLNRIEEEIWKFTDRLCEQTRKPEPKHWILGKRSSDDERLCETVIGSTNKIKIKSLFMIQPLEVVILWLLLPCISCLHFSLFSWIKFCFKLIELSEKLLFVTSFISIIISKLPITNKLEIDLIRKTL